MSLEQEGLVITLLSTISFWIIFESTASKDVVELALNDVNCRFFVADKSLEISSWEFLLWTSVQKLQREVCTVEPTLEYFPVSLNVNQ